nr:hypothetical protein MEP432_gp40 [Methylophilales phage MEP432]
MASKIKVDQIEGSTGSSITIPTGQTLTVTDGLAASTITSGTIADARIPNLDASKINAGTLPVARGGTGVTSLGTAGQALKVNSGATALEFGTVSSAIIGMEKVYFSDSNVSFTSQSGTNLTGNVYYPNSAKISGTYNKQQSNSHILMLVHYTVGHSNTNLHGTVAWRTGKESYYRNTGYDARAYGWYNTGSSGAYVMTDQIWFDGSSANDVQGTGNMTFNYVGAVSGTRVHSHELNFNPHSASFGGSNTDTPSKNTFSQITIIEYEA